MFKPIFIIGTSARAGDIPKGPEAAKNLLAHNLRIHYANSISDIDIDRIQDNYLWDIDEQMWVPLEQHKLSAYQKATKKIDQLFNTVKLELAERNRRCRNRGRGSDVKTWKQFTSQKQVAGEWLLGASRSWFATNKCIETITAEKFRIHNLQKIHAWANTALKWAFSKFETLYSHERFLQAVLHLDESNVHIHFQYLNCLYKYDNRQLRMVHSFTRSQKLTPNYLRYLQKDYCAHLNKQLIENRDWQGILLHSPSQKSYLNLFELKIHKLDEKYQNLKKLHHFERQHLHKIQNMKLSKLHCDFNAALNQYDPQAIKFIHKNLINRGYDGKTVNEICYPDVNILILKLNFH